jgi:hypothetical protein
MTTTVAEVVRVKRGLGMAERTLSIVPMQYYTIGGLVELEPSLADGEIHIMLTKAD